MRSLRVFLSVLAVAALVGVPGCAQKLTPDQERVKDFLERWGGVDPLAGLNVTMKVMTAIALHGSCATGDNSSKLDCHIVQLNITNHEGARAISALAFEGRLDNGKAARAAVLQNSTTLMPGDQHITVNFELPQGRTLTSIALGYAKAYATVDIQAYQFVPDRPHVNVLLDVPVAVIQKGRCSDGLSPLDRECHVFNVTVDNTQSEDELPAQEFYWRLTDSLGKVQHPKSSSADAIQLGAFATIQLRIEYDAATGVRVKEIQYQVPLTGLYGNATVPAYADR